MERSQTQKIGVSECLELESQVQQSSHQIFRRNLQQIILQKQMSIKNLKQYVVNNKKQITNRSIMGGLDSLAAYLSKNIKVITKNNKMLQQQKKQQEQNNTRLQQDFLGKLCIIYIMYLLSLQDKDRQKRKWSTYYQILNWVLITQFSQQIRIQVQQLTIELLYCLFQGTMPIFIQQNQYLQGQIVNSIRKIVSLLGNSNKNLIKIDARIRIFYSILSFSTISAKFTLKLLKIICIGLQLQSQYQLLKSVQQKFLKKLQNLIELNTQLSKFDLKDLQQLCQIFKIQQKSSNYVSQQRQSRIIDDNAENQLTNSQSLFQYNQHKNLIYALQFITQQLLHQFQPSKLRKQMLYICFNKIDEYIVYFYTFLVESYSSQIDEEISSCILSMIQKQSLRYISISRVKSLLKIIRCDNEQIKSDKKLKKYKNILQILKNIARKFKYPSRMYYFENQQTSQIKITNIHKCKTILFNLDISESKMFKIIRFSIGQSKKYYQLKLQLYGIQRFQYEICYGNDQKPQQLIKIDHGIKNTDKIRSIFLGITSYTQKKKNYLQFSLDGKIVKLQEISSISLTNIIFGPFHGSIKNLYALSQTINLIQAFQLYMQPGTNFDENMKQLTKSERYLFCLDKSQIKQKKRFWQQGMKTMLIDCQKISMISFYDALQQLGNLPTLLYLSSPNPCLIDYLQPNEIEKYYQNFWIFLQELAKHNNPKLQYQWMKSSISYFNEYIWLILNKCPQFKNNIKIFVKLIEYFSWHTHIQKKNQKYFNYGQMLDLKMEYQFLKKIYLNIETCSYYCQELQTIIYKLVVEILQHPLIKQQIMKEGYYQKILSAIFFFYLQKQQIQYSQPIMVLINILDNICSAYKHIEVNYNNKYVKRDINAFWSIVSQFIMKNKNNTKKHKNILVNLMKHFSNTFILQQPIASTIQIWPYILYQIGYLLKESPPQIQILSKLLTISIQIVGSFQSFNGSFEHFIIPFLKYREDPSTFIFILLIDITKNWPRKMNKDNQLHILFEAVHQNSINCQNNLLTYEQMQANLFSLHKSEFKQFFEQNKSMKLVQKSISQKQYFKMGVIILDRIIKYGLFKQLKSLTKYCYKWILTTFPKDIVITSQISQDQSQSQKMDQSYDEIVIMKDKNQQYNKAHTILLKNILKNPQNFYKLLILSPSKQFLGLCELIKLWNQQSKLISLPLVGNNMGSQTKHSDLGLLFTLKTKKIQLQLIQLLTVTWLNKFSKKIGKIESINNVSTLLLPSYVIPKSLQKIISLISTNNEQKIHLMLSLGKILRSFLGNQNFQFQFILADTLSKFSKPLQNIFINQNNKTAQLIQLSQQIFIEFKQALNKKQSKYITNLKSVTQILMDMEKLQTFKQYKAYFKNHEKVIKKVIQLLETCCEAYRRIILCYYAQIDFDQISVKIQNITQLSQIIMGNYSNQNSVNNNSQVLSDIQFYQPYSQLLRKKLGRIYKKYQKQAAQKQKHWKKLTQQNIFWDTNHIRYNQCYEIDQKITGSYRLNIVKAKFQEVPYPRRKSFKLDSLLQEKLSFQKNSVDNLIKFVEVVSQSEQQNQQIASYNSDIIKSDKKLLSNCYYAAYVTAKGIYAGILSIKKDHFYFQSIGFDNLPDENVYKYSVIYHKIEDKSFKIRINFTDKTQVFLRKFIQRYTAVEIFTNFKAYFFNLFKYEIKDKFFKSIYQKMVCVTDLRNQFIKRKFTYRWQIGALDNFQYLMAINKYSGRTYNDLDQYPVFPWVLTKYGTQIQNTEELLQNQHNYRDLTLPSGKLNQQKFMKLKIRCNQIQKSDYQIRFLYGTMYSNPTVIYNLFIRLEPYTSLHYYHQGKKIDHADRLFSSIRQQFSTVLTSSSDNKELTPQFYYWPQFLKNRNKVDLGVKQNHDEVHTVILPSWATNPEQFVFILRKTLQSARVTQKLNNWIDLIFGYKNPYDVAEQYDNLFHFRTYEHDIFQTEETQQGLKGAQITISQFGQIPFNLFVEKHPQKKGRGPIQIDKCITLFSQKQKQIHSFNIDKNNLIITTKNNIELFNSDLATLFDKSAFKSYYSLGYNALIYDLSSLSWCTLNQGIFRVYNKKGLLNEVDASCQVFCLHQKYIVFGIHTRIQLNYVSQNNTLSSQCIFYGHRSRIAMIKSSTLLDIIVSVDEDGLVMVHQISKLRLMRQFELDKIFKYNFDNKIKIAEMLIHQMGYFIFLTQNERLLVYTFLGELYLEQDLRISKQKIIKMDLLSDNSSQLIVGTNKGNIYLTNFIQIKKFTTKSPFKIYMRIKNNIIQNCRNNRNSGIKQMKMIKLATEEDFTYKLFVLYENNQFCCYIQSKKIENSLKNKKQLISLGAFF